MSFKLSPRQSAIVRYLIQEKRKCTILELQKIGGIDVRKRISEIRELFGCRCHTGSCQAEAHIMNETTPGESYDRYWITRKRLASTFASTSWAQHEKNVAEDIGLLMKYTDEKTPEEKYEQLRLVREKVRNDLVAKGVLTKKV